MADAWVDSTLSQLISALTTQRFKSQFSGLTNNADRVQFCQTHKIAQSWVDMFMNTFGSSEIVLKCPTTAARYREKGNARFGVHNFKSAVQLYSNAICFAPQTTGKTASELALAYGNRSAGYFQLGQHENALKDINAALALDYAQFKSATKLQLRKCDCLIQLGHASEAQELLRLMQPPIGDEKDTKRWFELFGRCSLADDKKKDESNPIPKACEVSLVEKLTNKGLFKSNEKMSSFSAKVAVHYDSVKGRHLVAQEDIQFGDILAVSRPYTAFFNSTDDDIHKCCHHCCRDIFMGLPSIRPVSCTTCSSVVYCSEECRTESANLYHRYECGHLHLLVQLPEFHRKALRLLYRAGMDQIRSVANSAENLNHFSEQPEGHYSHVYQLIHHSDGPLKDLNISYEHMLKTSISACLLLQLAKNGNFPMKTKQDENFIGGILLRHHLQLRFNTFEYSIYDKKGSSLSPVLPELFPMFASTLNHSCKPNARLEPSNHRHVCLLQAARPISAGTEITISYMKEDLYPGADNIYDNREYLLREYRFECNCTNCTYQIRNMPFGIDEGSSYYPLSCSKCSNLMERFSEQVSEWEVFRCTSCPLEMTNAEMNRRYDQCDQLLLLVNDLLLNEEIDGPKVNDDNSAWKYFKSTIERLGALLYHDSIGPAQRLIAGCHLAYLQFDQWWACNERFFSDIDYNFGTECIQFIETFDKMHGLQTPLTEQDMRVFKRMDKKMYQRYLARVEQCKQLKRKYYPDY